MPLTSVNGASTKSMTLRSSLITASTKRLVSLRILSSSSSSTVGKRAGDSIMMCQDAIDKREWGIHEIHDTTIFFDHRFDKEAGLLAHIVEQFIVDRGEARRGFHNDVPGCH